MSKSAPIDIEDRWYAGEAKNLHFDIVDADDAPLDVSTYALQWTLEAVTPGGGAVVDVLAKATGGAGITVTDGAATGDRVVVAVAAADTVALQPGVYRHALWRTDAGSEQLLSEGPAVLQDAAEAGV